MKYGTVCINIFEHILYEHICARKYILWYIIALSPLRFKCQITFSTHHLTMTLPRQSIVQKFGGKNQIKKSVNIFFLTYHHMFSYMKCVMQTIKWNKGLCDNMCSALCKPMNYHEKSELRSWLHMVTPVPWWSEWRHCVRH